MANILVVYQALSYNLRATTRDHLYCFRRYSGHRCYYLNVARRGEPFYNRMPAFLERVPFDLVIFYVDLLGLIWRPRALEYFNRQLGGLKQMKAKKVALVQDEYYNTEVLERFIREYGIEYVFSLAPESEWPKIYPNTDFEKVKFFRTLPGYLDEQTLARIEKLSAEAPGRPIDIGYRAHGIRHWLGRHGFLKIQIADEFQKQAAQSGLHMDISTRREDTFLGEEWYKFLLRCKYTIAVEGGASLQDRDGSIRRRTEAYLQQHPAATFDEVEQNCFPGLDGQFHYMAISPKHLEACATRTCQVLIEGDYNGVLTAGKHYIELKRDFSNIEQVLHDIETDHLRAQITEEAYRDIVASGRYDYRNFVRFVLDRSLPGGRGRSLLSEIYDRMMYSGCRLFEMYQRIRIEGLLVKYLPKFLTPVRTTVFNLRWYRKWWRAAMKALSPNDSLPAGQKLPYPIKSAANGQLTTIDQYWSQHTVYAPPFRSAADSKKNLQWRFDAHPLFRELSGLYGQHDQELVLDYGCGPGNDLTGFAVFTQARKIIGMDISARALAIAAQRLSLHNVPAARIDLIQVSDAEPNIPLPDEHVDFINCQGVLMHTSDPMCILKEFERVLKPGGTACLMVYNRDSIWFHLYTAYEKRLVHGEFSGLSLEDAFSRTTDGPNCPMARGYLPQEFVSMCETAGFQCEYMGGYLTGTEMKCIERHLEDALRDDRLSESSRQFLARLEFDAQGFPRYQGHYAGVSGVYRLSKEARPSMGQQPNQT